MFDTTVELFMVCKTTTTADRRHRFHLRFSLELNHPLYLYRPVQLRYFLEKQNQFQLKRHQQQPIVDNDKVTNFSALDSLRK